MITNTSTPALRMSCISAAWLREEEACEAQVVLFVEVFGADDVVIAPEMIRKAAEVGLNVDWAAMRLLSTRAWCAFARSTKAVREDYARACAAEKHKYYIATTAASLERDRVVATAGLECGRRLSRAWKEYNSTPGANWHNYDIATLQITRERFRVELQAMEECRRVCAAELEKYNRACDIAVKPFMPMFAEELIRVIWGERPGFSLPRRRGKQRVRKTQNGGN